VPLTLELEPEHRAELDRIRAERPDRPPSYKTPPSPHPRDRFVEPAVPLSVLETLRKNPMAASDPGRDEPGPVDKLDAFAAAVAARFRPGDRVSETMAAAAAGTSRPTAGNRIAALKDRGEWPYKPGVPGFRAGRGPANPAAPKPARAESSRPVAARIAAEPIVTPEPPAVAPAPAASIPIGGDLAATAARLREAADLIERAAAILKGGAA